VRTCRNRRATSKLCYRVLASSSNKAENGEYSKRKEVYATFTMNRTEVTGEYILTENGKLNTTISYTSNWTIVNSEIEFNSTFNNLAFHAAGTYAYNKNAKLFIANHFISKTTASVSITKLSNNKMTLRTPFIQRLSYSSTSLSKVVISSNK